ncbi:MAG: SDR family NAD(P)-dependent oxidoreductase [Ectothiorhodospiraceae bacterium]|nr:SDR family NAD(P)-dependent oxidoreductase [Ectothiorhodospiraceae bacterium]
MKWSKVNAIVTGGASGLGFAVVEKILAGGGQVAMADIELAIKKPVSMVNNNRCISVVMDVTNEDSVKQGVTRTCKQFGSINLLVNCAGILHSEKMVGFDSELSSDDFSHVLNVNLTGTFRVCREVARVMQENESEITVNANDNNEEKGLIINTASIAVYEGQIGQVAYSASKGGVASMTLPMARELARHHIRVMTIAPGMFETAMLENIPDEARNNLIEQSLFPHRMGRPDEFAQLVQHIVENPMLNGSVIRLDGGLRMPAK